MSNTGILVSLLVTVAAVVTAEAAGRDEGQRRVLSEEVAQSFIWEHPDPDVIRWGKQNNHFTWQAGYIMFAMEKMWLMTNDSTYYRYVRRYAEQNVGTDGSVKDFAPRALDNFMPGYACLMMYEATGEERYATAAETIRRGFDGYPRDRDSVFYHSVSKPQNWIDGVFMGQAFLARYARVTGHKEDLEEVKRQIRGMLKHCQKENGMLYHAYAERGMAGWSKTADAHSPEVWSEGMGWGALLMADVYDVFRGDKDFEPELRSAIVKMCRGLKACQDKATGLWYQVDDKPEDEGNWNETSGTGMFIYFLQTAVDKGIVSAGEYVPVIDKAYNGLIQKAVRNSDGGYNLTDCSSIGVKGSYEAYVTQPREISTYAAFGSFMLGAGIVEHRLRSYTDKMVYATDYTGGHVVVLRGDSIVRQYEAKLTNDIWAMADGGLLFVTGEGAEERDASGERTWEYRSDSHVFACQRLRDGLTMIGEAENARIVEVDTKGRAVSKTLLPVAEKCAKMSYMRNVRKTDAGTYLVAHYGEDRVTEYDKKGRTVWGVEVKGRPHTAIRLPNGNTMIAVADGDKNPRIIEVDKAGEVVWSLSNKDLAGMPLRFASGMHVLRNGDIAITNWQGHKGAGGQAHIMVVSRDKRIRACYYGGHDVRTISSVMIEGEGDVH